MIPGEIIVRNDQITINESLEVKVITVCNEGDRPIQVGSHIHFFEINKFMKFDREKAFGYRLDIASGTAVRFEPGEKKEVSLVLIAGNRIIKGINNLTDGQVNLTLQKTALLKAELKGF
jgi:urease beta subunit